MTRLALVAVLALAASVGASSTAFASSASAEAAAKKPAHRCADENPRMSGMRVRGMTCPQGQKVIAKLFRQTDAANTPSHVNRGFVVRSWVGRGALRSKRRFVCRVEYRRGGRVLHVFCSTDQGESTRMRQPFH